MRFFAELNKAVVSPRAEHKAPTIYSRSEHNISRSHISKQALKVLYRLKDGGYEAYLVGGCVRDLLLGLTPKDFDVATNASPEQVKELFRNCRLIGRRFRLAHVHFGRDIIEVATFRGTGNNHPDDDRVLQDGRLLRDNVFGSLEEDAWRRDFSVNALYYNIRDFSLVDYVGGMKDLEQRTLRMLGDPIERYQEDPVRMIRAIRFAAKLDFTIHPDSEQPIKELAPLLHQIPSSRLFDESIKLLLADHAAASFEHVLDYGLLEHLYPQTDRCLKQDPSGPAHAMITRAMLNTESRLQQGKSVTPYFLLAALLWAPVRTKIESFCKGTEPDYQTIQKAADRVISEQLKCTSIPRRLTTPMREVWSLQPRFLRRQGTRCLRFLNHPRFRAAYDFYLLRSEVGEADPNIADWWTQIQELPTEEQKAMTKTEHTGRKRRRKPARPKPPPAA